MPLRTPVLTVLYILNGCNSATLCTKQDLSDHFPIYCLRHCHTLYKIGPVLSFPHVLPVALSHSTERDLSYHFHMFPVALPHSVQNRTCPIISSCIACGAAMLCTKQDLSYHFQMCCLWHCHTLYRIGPVLAFPVCCLWHCHSQATPHGLALSWHLGKFNSIWSLRSCCFVACTVQNACAVALKNISCGS